MQVAVVTGRNFYFQAIWQANLERSEWLLTERVAYLLFHHNTFLQVDTCFVNRWLFSFSILSRHFPALMKH